jgi:hypothetical protein
MNTSLVLAVALITLSLIFIFRQRIQKAVSSDKPVCVGVYIKASGSSSEHASVELIGEVPKEFKTGLDTSRTVLIAAEFRPKLRPWDLTVVAKFRYAGEDQEVIIDEHEPAEIHGLRILRGNQHQLRKWLRDQAKT